MFTPGTHNFIVYQGSTLRKSFTWNADGAPVDLTGFTARCQLRTSLGSPVVELEMSSANSGVIIDAQAGKITLYASAAATAELNEDSYVYDVDVTDSQGDTFRLVQGMITLSRGVTR